MKRATMLTDREVSEIRSMLRLSIASLSSLPESYQRDLTIRRLESIELILITESKLP